MTTIEIPFSRDMAFAAIDGRKVATTRSEAKGQIGDTFEIEEPRDNFAKGDTCLYVLIEIMAADPLRHHP